MKHLIKYYLNRLYLWHIRKNFPYWWIRLHCNCCGKDVFKHKGDYFMLKQEVWQKITENPYINETYILCRKCAERALGRKFTKEDFYEEEEFKNA